MAPKGQMGLELFPDELDSLSFVRAWADWLADRAERRLPRYTARAREKQLKRLAEMGEERAIAAIEWSIAQGYKGIFEPPVVAEKQAGKSLGPTKPAQPSTWELQKKLELVEGRMKELKGRSPGEHCELYDFLSREELEEYSRLIQRRKELRQQLLQ